MNQKQGEGLRTLLIVLIGQVGCVTLGVIAVSLGLGVWLDGVFHTGKIITLVLLLAGIPVSVILMLFLSRRTLAKLQAQRDGQQDKMP